MIEEMETQEGFGNSKKKKKKESNGNHKTEK